MVVEEGSVGQVIAFLWSPDDREQLHVYYGDHSPNYLV